MVCDFGGVGGGVVGAAVGGGVPHICSPVLNAKQADIMFCW